MKQQTIEEPDNIHNTRKGCNIQKQSSALQWTGSQMDLKTDRSKGRPGVGSCVLRGSDRWGAVGPGMGMGTCYKQPHWVLATNHHTLGACYIGCYRKYFSSASPLESSAICPLCAAYFSSVMGPVTGLQYRCLAMQGPAQCSMDHPTWITTFKGQ